MWNTQAHLSNCKKKKKRYKFFLPQFVPFQFVEFSACKPVQIYQRIAYLSNAAVSNQQQ